MTKIFLIGIALLSGCSSLSHKDFNRGDVAEKQFMMDSAYCEMENLKVTNDPYSMGVYDACMRSKGYLRK